MIKTIDNIDFKEIFIPFIKKYRINNNQLIGLCPFHEDTHPSFSVNLDKGIYYCHACGKTGNSTTFLSEVLNITTREAYKKIMTDNDFSLDRKKRYEDTVSSYLPESSKKDITNISKMTQYNYHNEYGDILYFNIRLDYIDENGKKGKKFHYEYHNEAGHLIKRKPKKRVMYNLNKVVSEKKYQEYLFIVEGEKCADTINRLGLLSTTTGSSSSYSEWTKEYNKHIKDYKVIILPDNDDAGRRYAFEIASRIYPDIEWVKIIDLYTLTKDKFQVKADIVDYLNMGENIETVIAAAEKEDNFKISEEESRILNYELNDTGNSCRFEAMYGDKILYNNESQQWYVWDNIRWQPDISQTHFRYAINCSDEFYNESKKSKSYGIRKFALNSGNLNRLKAMIDITAKKTNISYDQMDRYPNYISLLNGTMDLKNEKLFSNKKENYLTKCLNFSYYKDSDCPNFLKFLNEIFDRDAELINYIQRVFGYCLTGEISEQVFFIAYGTGANGKSTLIDIISYILEEYVQSIPISVLMGKERASAATPELAKAKGSRLVIASESSDISRVNEGQIKQLTGNDIINARPLYSQGFTYKPEFKIWLSTNHKPYISGSDYGIWRRVHLIPFNVTFDESKRDKNLADKLKSEATGILNWIVKGAYKWYKEGLNPPKTIMDAVSEYRSEMDILADFLDTCTVTITNPNSTETVSHKDLYDCYLEYSRMNGQAPMSANLFGRKLTERGFKKYKAPMLVYINLTLKPRAVDALRGSDSFNL